MHIIFYGGDTAAVAYTVECTWFFSLYLHNWSRLKSSRIPYRYNNAFSEYTPPHLKNRISPFPRNNSYTVLTNEINKPTVGEHFYNLLNLTTRRCIFHANVFSDTFIRYLIRTTRYGSSQVFPSRLSFVFYVFSNSQTCTSWCSFLYFVCVYEYIITSWKGILYFHDHIIPIPGFVFLLYL